MAVEKNLAILMNVAVVSVITDITVAVWFMGKAYDVTRASPVTLLRKWYSIFIIINFETLATLLSKIILLLYTYIFTCKKVLNFQLS